MRNHPGGVLRLALILSAVLATPAAFADAPRDLGPSERAIREPLSLAGIKLTDDLTSVRERSPELAVRRVATNTRITRVEVLRAHAEWADGERVRALTVVATPPGRLFRITETREDPALTCASVFAELRRANGPAVDRDEGYRRWERIGVDRAATLSARCENGTFAVARLVEPGVLIAYAREVERERSERRRRRQPKGSVPPAFR